MLKINFNLEITRNGEHVNTFKAEGEKALAEMVKAISHVHNRKNYFNIKSASIHGDRAKKVVKAMIKFDNGFKYDYTFTGEDIENVYVW